MICRFDCGAGLLPKTRPVNARQTPVRLALTASAFSTFGLIASIPCRASCGVTKSFGNIIDHLVVVQFEKTGRIAVEASPKTCYILGRPLTQVLKLNRMTESRLPRPRDPAQLSKLIGDILTGQIEDRAPERPADPAKDQAAVALGRKGARKGGLARAASMSAKQRVKIARKAAMARWGK